MIVVKPGAFWMGAVGPHPREARFKMVMNEAP